MELLNFRVVLPCIRIIIYSDTHIKIWLQGCDGNAQPHFLLSTSVIGDYCVWQSCLCIANNLLVTSTASSSISSRWPVLLVIIYTQLFNSWHLCVCLSFYYTGIFAGVHFVIHVFKKKKCISSLSNQKPNCIKQAYMTGDGWVIFFFV